MRPKETAKILKHIQAAQENKVLEKQGNLSSQSLVQ